MTPSDADYAEIKLVTLAERFLALHDPGFDKARPLFFREGHAQGYDPFCRDFAAYSAKANAMLDDYLKECRGDTKAACTRLAVSMDWHDIINHMFDTADKLHTYLMTPDNISLEHARVHASGIGRFIREAAKYLHRQRTLSPRHIGGGRM